MEKYLHGKNILVTGGTGFVGHHLLPLLIEYGANVTCITRQNSKLSTLPKECNYIHADLSTGTNLEKAFENKDIIIHMAALLFGLNWQDYIASNAKAATNIATALNKIAFNGKIILISSLSARGPNNEGPISAYGWSKLFSENIFTNATKKELVILRPPIIYGSFDKGLLPVFKGIKHGFAVSPGYNREFPVSIIHAKDIAKSIVYACHENASGIYYPNDGNPITMKFFCEKIAESLNKDNINVWHIPLPIMAFTAFSSTIYGTLLKKIQSILGCNISRAPNWNLDKYLEAKAASWITDDTRLNSDTNFTPDIDLESGLKETVDWYQKAGWL